MEHSVRSRGTKSRLQISSVSNTSLFLTSAALAPLYIGSIVGPARAAGPPVSTDASDKHNDPVEKKAKAAKQAATETKLEDIVVTAQKRRQNVNDVPATITAVSGRRMADAGVTNLSSLSLLAPGVDYAKSSQNTPILTMRGIGFNTPNVSSTSPVGIYVDEVAYAYPFMASGPLFDLDRTEVLKGPQGTLYGRNTTAGLINFITAQPGDHFQAGVETEIGNYATYNTEGYVSGPVIPDLAVRFAFRDENSLDGWQHNIVTGATLGRKDDGAARLTLVYKPFEDFTDNFMASYWINDSDTVAPQAVLYTPQQPAFVNPLVAGQVRADWKNSQADWDSDSKDEPPLRAQDSFWSFANRATWEISPLLSLTSLTAYNVLRRNDMTDGDGTNVEVLGYDAYGHIHSFSQELRASGQIQKIKYIFGGYYSQDYIVDDQVGYYDQSSTRYFLANLAQNVFDPKNLRYSAQQYATGFEQFRDLSDQSSRSESVFGDIDVPVTKRWDLSGGLRYSDDLLKYGTCSADFDGNTRPLWNVSVGNILGNPDLNVGPNQCQDIGADRKTVAPFEQPSLDENNVAWRVGSDYKLTPHDLLYVTISRGYKSAASAILPATFAFQYYPAKQERVTNYELGSKNSLFNDRVQADVSAFYDYYGDKQEYGTIKDPIFGSLDRLINIPKSDVVGFDLQLKWVLRRGLTYNVGVTYAHSNIISYQGYDQLGAERNYDGSTFAYSPTWQGTTGIAYATLLTEDLFFHAGVDASYQSRSYSVIGNDPRFEIKAYPIVNLYASIQSDRYRWNVEFYARNLFNENYWTSVTYETDTIFRTPGMPTTFGVKLGYTFR